MKLYLAIAAVCFVLVTMAAAAGLLFLLGHPFFALALLAAIAVATRVVAQAYDA